MRILLVTGRHPWPPRRGDQLRAVQLAALLGRQHLLTLLVPAPEPPAPAAPEGPWEVVLYRAGGGLARARGLAAALLARRPLQSGLFAHADLGDKLRRLAAEADLVVLQLVRLAPHLAAVGETPLLVDFIDSLSLNFERRAARDRPWLAPLLAAESRRLARWEDRLLARAARALVVCERDREHLAGRQSPEVAARLIAVPLAMSSRAPAASPEGADAGPAPAGAARSGPGVAAAVSARSGPLVVMTGNLGYFPNADGGSWLCRRVWPLVRRRRPDARLLLAGDRPSRRLAAAARAAGAEIVASPPDLAAVLARASVAVAPLRAGSGLPIKVLEAWAQGVPVVATPWAAAGTTGRPGRDFLVAEGPEEWAEAVLGLLDDPGLRQRLAAAGRRRLEEDYSEEVVAAKLAAATAAAVG